MDRTIGHQVAAQGRCIQQLNPRGVTCPLHAGSLPHHPPTRWDLASYLLSRLLASGQEPVICAKAACHFCCFSPERVMIESLVDAGG
jgi:hypothetical protein